MGPSFFRSFEMPFGGYKYSGIGHEGYVSAADEVTHLKTIVLKEYFGLNIKKLAVLFFLHCQFLWNESHAV